MITGTITIFCTPTGWLASFSGEAADEVRALFQTDTIPTPFTAAAPAETVRDTVQKGWPACTVEVRP